jgi:spore germination cell wall hydrolase CwlJ-like protein
MRIATAAALTIALAVPAFAETVTSRSTGPVTGMLAALMGAEKSAIARLPDTALAPRAPVKTAAQKAARKGKTPAPPTYDAAWLATLPVPEQQTADLRCLTTALYFEARGESVAGQAAVAEVILNRAESPLYPGTVCGVVTQGCQFSYVCDGRADVMTDPAARSVATRIAAAMLGGAPRLLTQGATHFHTPAVRPSWSKRFPRTASIGYHIFYRQPGAGTVGQVASN